MKSIFITASFMSMGLCEGTGPGFFDRVLDRWDNGCYELIDRLTGYAPYACRLLAAGLERTGGNPGVADYEVSETFGVWFGQMILQSDEVGMDPAPATCHAKLLDLTYAFFAQGMDDTDVGKYERTALREALEDVPTDTPSAETLPDAVAQFVMQLERIGFGRDEPISGADCVDVVNDNFPDLRNFVV